MATAALTVSTVLSNISEKKRLPPQASVRTEEFSGFTHGALFISTESIYFVKANAQSLAACRLRCSRTLLEGPPFRNSGDKSPTHIAHKRKLRQCLSSKWPKSSFMHNKRHIWPKENNGCSIHKFSMVFLYSLNFMTVTAQ